MEGSLNREEVVLSAKQYRAYSLYATTHGYKITLGVPGSGKFSFSDDGKLVEVPITEVVAYYQTHLKERSKERARERRMAQQK